VPSFEFLDFESSVFVSSVSGFDCSDSGNFPIFGIAAAEASSSALRFFFFPFFSADTTGVSGLDSSAAAFAPTFVDFFPFLGEGFPVPPLIPPGEGWADEMSRLNFWCLTPYRGVRYHHKA
jgi:hypothetical protein